jgi:hypothetical protein
VHVAEQAEGVVALAHPERREGAKRHAAHAHLHLVAGHMGEPAKCVAAQGHQPEVGRQHVHGIHGGHMRQQPEHRLAEHAGIAATSGFAHAGGGRCGGIHGALRDGLSSASIVAGPDFQRSYRTPMRTNPRLSANSLGS